MSDERPSTINHFCVLSFTDDYWRLPMVERRALHDEWTQRFNNASGTTHFYQASLMRARGDLLLWSAAEHASPDVPAEFFESLTRAMNPMRSYMRVEDVLWGATRPSPYSRARSAGAIDPFRPERLPYLVVYPFTKTSGWYVKDQESRQHIMNGHIRIGKQYRDIPQLLLYSFGLQDQEFVVVYETHDLTRFSALVQDLRATDARLYTERDTPLYTGIHRPAADPFGAWTEP
jgi:chlorite dismutase